MSETTVSYKDFVLDQLRSIYADTGQPPSAEMCVILLETDHPENRKIREHCLETFRIDAREWDDEVWRKRVREDLGCVPRTPGEYVAVMVGLYKITTAYTGVLTKREIPYLPRPDGGRDYISPDLFDNPEFASLIRSKFHCQMSIVDFELDCRRKAADLKLKFKASDIDDAARQWHRDARLDRIPDIAGEIAYTDIVSDRVAGQAHLRSVVEACFDCQAVSPDYVVAVLVKFIWQVKRKLDGLPIFNHLMPVILGEQGKGKSTLVLQMLSPVRELVALSNFGQITDDRNIDLWSHYVLFLDEMAKATKADIDTVKHVVTADTLTLRPMRTNNTVHVPQRGTLIGCANETSLADLIRDPTGMRRFAGITMARLDADVVNKVNWMDVWRSVDHIAPDPMLPYVTTLQAEQEASRNRTTFEEWLDHIAHSAFARTGEKFTAAQAYILFKEHEAHNNPGLKALTSSAKFARMMAATFSVGRADALFDMEVKDNRNLFHWRGKDCSPPVSPVTSPALSRLKLVGIPRS